MPDPVREAFISDLLFKAGAVDDCEAIASGPRAQADASLPAATPAHVREAFFDELLIQAGAKVDGLGSGIQFPDSIPESIRSLVSYAESVDYDDDGTIGDRLTQENKGIPEDMRGAIIRDLAGTRSFWLRVVANTLIDAAAAGGKRRRKGQLAAQGGPVACRQWQKGHCSFGNRCRFGHG